jgi:uncharacterized protein YndB with AHSA1/START domain
VIDGDRVVHEVHYAHPVSAVWEALTDPAALAAWLMPNDFAPVVGHRFRLDARPELGFIDCEVLDVEPPHLLRYTWTVDGALTTVTVQLRADSSGTLLRLDHEALGTERRGGVDQGWGDKLHDDLRLVLTGGRDPARSRVGGGVYRHPDLEASQ